MDNTQIYIQGGNWLTSKEAKAVLKVSDCHLMHLRLQGKLVFKKEKNKFLYLLDQALLANKGNSSDL